MSKPATPTPARIPTEQPVVRSWRAPIVTVLALLTLILGFSAPGSLGSGALGAGFAAVAQVWIESGGVAAAWLLGALGLGRAVRPLLRGASGGVAPRSETAASGGWTIQLSVGVAIMLTLSHGLGAIGLLGAGLSMPAAWAPVVVGLIMLFDQTRSRENRPELWGAIPASALFALPGVAVLVVAACAPPGTLWASEARGYDTLSYHLQLPREWLEQARIAPLEHNVYSCLPSYVEAAYAHLAAMLATGAGALTDDVGRGIFAAQILHAMFAIASAAALGRLVALLSSQRNDSSAQTRASVRAGGFAAAAFLLTPWVIVVGSMAYNEMVVLLMLIGALVVVREEGLSPVRRGVLIGVILGAAVSAKLTAAYMAVPVIAIAILSRTNRSAWLPTFAAAAFAAMAYLAPWLIRNAVWLGNPVFPFATGIFGAAHWSPEQVIRWNGAHHVTADWLERATMLFSVRRGAMHPHWFIFFPTALAAAALAIRDRGVRSIAILLTAALAVQAMAWLVLGHLQSRFLLPAAPIGAALIGLGTATILRRPVSSSTSGSRALNQRVKWLAPVVAAMFTLAGAISLSFLSQNDARPNLALVQGVGAINGAIAGAALPRLSPAERRELLDSLGPPALINLAFAGASFPISGQTRRDARIYLLGDATPLYMRPQVLYNTTWDTWPLADSLRRRNHDLNAAVADLANQGVTHILVNLDEIARLHADGWADPLITPDLAVRLVRECGTVVWRWSVPGSTGVCLLEIADQTSPATDSMP